MRIWQTSGLALLAAVLLAGPVSAQQGEAEQPGEKPGVYAEVTGWFYGMYLGESKAAFYPFVLEVDENGAARQAGIRRGDEILRFQDQDVRGLRELHRSMARLKPGDRIRLTLRRSAQMMMLEFTVPENPTARPQPKVARAQEPQNPDAPKRRKRRRPPVVLRPLPPRDGTP